MEWAFNDFYGSSSGKGFRANLVNIGKNLPRNLKLRCDFRELLALLDFIIPAKIVIRKDGPVEKPLAGKLTPRAMLHSPYRR